MTTYNERPTGGTRTEGCKVMPIRGLENLLDSAMVEYLWRTGNIEVARAWVEVAFEKARKRYAQEEGS